MNDRESVESKRHVHVSRVLKARTVGPEMMLEILNILDEYADHDVIHYQTVAVAQSGSLFVGDKRAAEVQLLLTMRKPADVEPTN